MLAIDTLKLARRLREGAGFTPEHAEAVAETFAEAMTEQVASKSDLRETELRLSAGLRETELHLTANIEKVRTELETKIDMVRTGLEARISQLDSKLDKTRVDLEAKIETSAANTKADILKWMFGAMAAQTALIAGLIKLIH